MSRFTKAVQAALPYLTTQQDAIDGRLAAVPAVYNFPITQSERLRQEAKALEVRDAIIDELRAAYREAIAMEEFQDKPQ